VLWLALALPVAAVVLVVVIMRKATWIQPRSQRKPPWPPVQGAGLNFLRGVEYDDGSEEKPPED
jgi:hypothetical protein